MSDISRCNFFHYISYSQTQANNYLNNKMVQRADTAASVSQYVCMADIRNSSAFALRNPFTRPLLPKRPSNLQRSSLHPQTCANFGIPFTTNTRLKAQRLAKQGLARFRLSQNTTTNSGRLSWALFIDQTNNTHDWVRDGGMWITAGPTDDP